jgi:hypothetical protein
VQQSSLYILYFGAFALLLLTGWMLYFSVSRFLVPATLGTNWEISIQDPATDEQVVITVSPGERGFQVVKREAVPVLGDSTNRVAGASIARTLPSPLGVYTAFVTTQTCSASDCTGENAVRVKWKYSPLSRKIIDGASPLSLTWLDDSFLLIETGNQILLVDVAGTIHFATAGRLVSVRPSS